MDLLLKIARCPLVESWYDDHLISNKCYEILTTQQVEFSAHQIPEPWSGDITKAPILFLSSNPSIDNNSKYPVWDWPDDQIEDYFSNRFGGRQQWIEDGIRCLNNDGSRTTVRFWAAVKARARELLEKAPMPGKDYALTEVVHCKSRNEVGVAQVLSECVKRYLRPVLSEASGAKIIVVLGNIAGQTLKQEFKMPANARMAGPVEVGLGNRYLVFLPHPNFRGPRTFRDCLEPSQLETLREALRN
ncbi:uracil-DNA glycosylase family protein [Rhodomicrobium lacus]|uniref:uracil-DNA glycosylase family protein n=1 Tax=Rhodomicrobium lacus TaxID=2498452 RepID=UPI000F8EEB32|nr:uracil-DNA glycosylase family protein [Rhodomicrobium lacus]